MLSQNGHVLTNEPLLIDPMRLREILYQNSSSTFEDNCKSLVILFIIILACAPIAFLLSTLFVYLYEEAYFGTSPDNDTFILSTTNESTKNPNTREIKVYNNCDFTTWAGIFGPGNPAGGGFRLNAGETRSVHVDDAWTSGRIWPRTECDGNMNCATGSCGPREQCNGAGGEQPASLAEFTLSGLGGFDYYDVSLVDGYNIPVLIDAHGGRGEACKGAGVCFKDINDLCPEDLAVKRNGRTVACKSECLAYNNDKACCRGAFATSEKCKPSKTAMLFKDACPGAYSYPFDDVYARACKGATYVVQFC